MSDQEHVESIADEDILRNLADGCSRCFELLFHRYSRPVYSIPFRILRDRAESEDILQEVFLSIYLQQERFDPARGSVRTWILQFAYFKSLLRRRYLNVRHFYKQQEVLEGLELRSNDAPELMGLTPTEWGQYV